MRLTSAVATIAETEQMRGARCWQVRTLELRLEHDSKALAIRRIRVSAHRGIILLSDSERRRTNNFHYA